MRIEIRADSVVIDGYVNAVARDSRPILGEEGKFVEQIMPGAFTRALEKAEAENRPIKILLNHDWQRGLGDTNTNLKLFEDNIGLRAICEITDEEVVKKAKEQKLRGWSFGFYNATIQEEEYKEGLKRRYVEGLELEEVSIIDDRKVPCYEGTSVYTRADKSSIEIRSIDIVNEVITEIPIFDDKLQDYKNRIKELQKGRKNA